MLHAEPCPAGVMCVVIDKGFGGVIFHEACGHSLEATAVAFGNSEFCGQAGRSRSPPPSSPPSTTARCPTNGAPSTSTTRATPTTRLVLIENGVLKNYMVDRLNGRRMGMAPSPAAPAVRTTPSRPPRACATPSSPPATTMRRRSSPPCGDGLYAKSHGRRLGQSRHRGVQLRRGRGLSRHGTARSTGPVRGATLIGKGADILKKIDRVGKDAGAWRRACAARLSG